MKYIPKLQTAWSPLTLTSEKEQAAQKLIQQRALQGYNTSGVNWLKETPEITSKRKALAAKQQTEYQNKRFANRTNEVPVLGMPAATQIGLKNVHPEFALMTGGVGSGMSGIKGAMGYGAIQGGLWNSAGIAGEQNLEGLVGDVIGGGIAGGVIKVASPYIKKGAQNIYKINPFAEKLVDKNSSFRIAGYDAYQDFLTSGVVRSGNGARTGQILNGVEITRPTPFPSFQKGFADKKYLQKGMNNVIFKTKVPTFARGERNPVTGNIIRGRHYAHRPIDMNTGEVIKELPGNLVEVFSQNPHWLKGYQKIKPQLNSNFESSTPHTTPFLDDIQKKEAYARIAKSAMRFMKLQKSPEFQKRYKEFAYGWHTGSDINIINPEVIPYQVFNNTSRSANPSPYMFKDALGFFDNNQNKAFVKINTNSDLEQTTGHELLHKFTKANYRNEYHDNPNWENKWWFDEFASKKYPGNLPEEHLANMIGYRVSKNIPPERNFTAEESIDFINNHMRLYNNTIKQRHPNYKENLTSAVEFIKAFGAVAAPVTIADKFKK